MAQMTIEDAASREVEAAAAEGPSEDLKRQVEFCLSNTYIALSKPLQSTVTNSGPKAMSMPLSVILSVLPTPEAAAPEESAVRAALQEVPNVEVSEDDVVTYSGRTVPSATRIRECCRKSVIVDGLAADTTAEGVRELLESCGRIISVGLCHPRLSATYAKGVFYSRTLHGIVQFASVKEAAQAVGTMNFSWRGGPRVTHVLVDFRTPSPLKPRNQKVTRPTSTDSSSSDDSMNDAEEVEGVGAENMVELTILPDAPKKSKKHKKKKVKAKGGAVESDSSKGQSTPWAEHHVKKDYASWAAAVPQNRSPGPRFVNTRAALNAPGAPVVDGVRARMPRGPDGTRGFTMGRGRTLPVPT